MSVVLSSCAEPGATRALTVYVLCFWNHSECAEEVDSGRGSEWLCLCVLTRQGVQLAGHHPGYTRVYCWFHKCPIDECVRLDLAQFCY